MRVPTLLLLWVLNVCTMLMPSLLLLFVFHDKVSFKSFCQPMFYLMFAFLRILIRRHIFICCGNSPSNFLYGADPKDFWDEFFWGSKGTLTCFLFAERRYVSCRSYHSCFQMKWQVNSANEMAIPWNEKRLPPPAPKLLWPGGIMSKFVSPFELQIIFGVLFPIQFLIEFSMLFVIASPWLAHNFLDSHSVLKYVRI